MNPSSSARAVILAAGRGSRMGGLTSDQPKCMTELGGKTLVRHQLDALKGGGAEQCAIVRGYLADTFTLPVAYFDNPRWAQTNMVASLVCAQPWLESGTTVVSYSDIVYGPDSVARLMAAQGDIVITYDPHWRRLWELRFDEPLSDAETFRTDAAGRLLEIGGRADCLDQIAGQYMGLLRFTPSGWKTVYRYLKAIGSPAVDRLDMTSLLQRLLDQGVTIDTVAIAEPWYEVDTESDLALYREKFFRGHSEITSEAR